MQDFMPFLANHLVLSYALATVFVALMIIEIIRLKNMNYRIDVIQAIQLINRQHAKVVDIRSNDAFGQKHIIDAHSIPANELAKQTKKLEKLKSHPVILVCATGVESQKLAAHLQKQGYNIYSLSGGMRAWIEAEMPTMKE